VWEQGIGVWRSVRRADSRRKRVGEDAMMKEHGEQKPESVTKS
jgi:hypothetical protein